MDRVQLLKKLEALLSEWEKNRTWGSIEVVLSDGRTDLIRISTTQKLHAKESKLVRGYEQR